MERDNDKKDRSFVEPIIDLESRRLRAAELRAAQDVATQRKADAITIRKKLSRDVNAHIDDLRQKFYSNFILPALLEIHDGLEGLHARLEVFDPLIASTTADIAFPRREVMIWNATKNSVPKLFGEKKFQPYGGFDLHLAHSPIWHVFHFGFDALSDDPDESLARTRLETLDSIKLFHFRVGVFDSVLLAEAKLRDGQSVTALLETAYRTASRISRLDRENIRDLDMERRFKHYGQSHIPLAKKL